MFDLSPEKILVLGILALLVLGPNRLPDAARALGRLLGQARAMTSSLQTEVREALNDPNDAITSAISEFRPGQVRRTVRRAVTDSLTGTPASAAALTVVGSPGSDDGPSPSLNPAASGPLLGAPSSPGPGWPYVPDDPALN